MARLAGPAPTCGSSLPAALLALVLAACGGPSTPAEGVSPPDAPPGLNQTAPTVPAGDATGAGGHSAAPAASATSPGPAAPPERFAGAPFPPPAYEALHGRTAKPEDGQWQSLPMPLGAPPAMAISTVHPHAVKDFVFVKVVAFDRRQLDLRLVAGTQEPESKTVPAERRPGLVPGQDQGSLVVVFNGGFKAKHGKYGMLLDGELFVPPRDDACVVAQYPDESIQIRSWSVLSGETEKMSAYRQTPLCLVEQGKLNPRLDSEYKSRRWGSAVGGVQAIRRSAIGLDASGRSLLYGFGEWVTPKELALAMQAAGAVDVAQLDINWSYTRFFLFDHPPGEPPHIRETIIPKLKFSKNRYIGKFSYRDFYYVKQRPRSAP
ncbi:MAG: hypothetical protein JRI68_22785 [Deltaproteobacteria bacterium]|nr:hypothetical protein [Deltaproteobacteria bacterium]